MAEKIGRNDPCPCGSGKKYKQCCLLKKTEKPATRKLKAVWVNQPVQNEEPVSLIERTFGSAISKSSDKPPMAFPRQQKLIQENPSESESDSTP